LLYSITDLRARPERVGEAEEIGRRMAEWGRRAPATLNWALYEVTSGPFGTYRVEAGAETWERLGAVSTLEALLGGIVDSQETEQVAERIRDCFASIVQSVMRDRPELGRPASAAERPPVVELTRISVRLDGRSDTEAYFRRLAQAAEKLGDARRFEVRETVVGGAGSYTLHTGVGRLGELDGMRTPAQLLAEAFGPVEARRLWGRVLASLDGAERQLLLRRDDLSVLR
jgi:hypothetical protein